jgi:hypothetical protein
MASALWQTSGMVDPIFQTRFVAPAILCGALLWGMAGCTPVDNSGGDPPPGQLIPFTAVALPQFFCGHFADRAELVLDDAAADGLVDDCPENAGEDGPVKDSLKTLVADADEGTGLVVVFAQLGGCITDASVVGFYRDGDLLHTWIKRADVSHGDGDMACPADIGEKIVGYYVEGAQDVSGVDVVVGTFNPDRPGAPELL